MKDETCKERAEYLVNELAKCQANNVAAGYNPGYLAGFPETEFDDLENRTLKTGNVPYYALHKTLAGLLDVYRTMGDNQALDVLLSLAAWVDWRTSTSRLSFEKMQRLMGTEFGGMAASLVDLWHQTGDERWITVAQRFDQSIVFDPLAANQDKLDGLHANTQVPKWIAAARQYKATGTKRYRDIAFNAWNFTISSHTYAIGGNSQAEHFHAPNAITKYLARDTAEGCNTYNMLKLTRELFTLDPEAESSTAYFDYYERALLNHLLGQQDRHDPHGHITYFTPMKPGGRRGVGPWGESRYSDDYGSFWCCQGTGIETNTKLMDSIYFRSKDNRVLYINLFAPSTLTWPEQKVTITQTTSFPVSESTKLRVSGAGRQWTMRIRIPSWTSGAEVLVNGKSLQGLTITPGKYAEIMRSWTDGDEVEVKLPMNLRLIPANDRPDIAALAFGPTILSGNYGDSSLDAIPTIELDSIRRVGNLGLEFTATSNGRPVMLSPFFDAHGFNYNVYWATKGRLTSLPGQIGS